MSVRSTVSRMRSTAGLLAAVATMVLVACALVALVPVYSAAIVDAGLRATVSEATASRRTISVSVRAPASESGRIATAVDELPDPDSEAFDTVLLARSAPHAVVEPPIAPDDATGATVVTALAAWWGDDVFTVSAGDLDAVVAAPGGAGPFPAALHEDAAALLGVTVGDVVILEPAGVGAGSTTTLTITAIVVPSDPADPRWSDSPAGRTGVIASGSFTEVGPFYVSADAFASLPGDAGYSARFALDAGAVTADGIDGLVAIVDRADTEIAEALAPHTARIDSEVGALLRDTDTSVRSTSAVVSAILLQLAAVAMYGLGVAAAVLVASRQGERSLLNSRGITTGQVARDSATEAIAIAVPAALAAPFLAVAAVGLVGRWGPVANTGLELDAVVSPLAFALSLGAAAVAVAVIVWPAVAASRTPDGRRRATEPFLRRTGLDIALFVAAALGLWQLARTGTVATSSAPDARASVDPVLVLAPTLGIAAGSLLALRVLATAARGLERMGTTSRRLAPALAGWEAARERSRRDRSSILLVVTVAIITFAIVYSVSWQTSQRDQAGAAVGADVVATPDRRPDAVIGPASLPSSYRSIDGVLDVAPIEDRTAALTSRLGTVRVVALDTARFDRYSRTRDDIVADVGAVEALAERTPDLGGVDLPPAGGEVTARVAVSATTEDILSGETIPTGTVIELAIVFADEFGTLHRMGAEEIVVAVADQPVVAEVSFGSVPAVVVDGRAPTLVELEVSVSVPVVPPLGLDLDGDGELEVSPFDVPGVDVRLDVSDLAAGGRPLSLATSTWRTIAPEPARATLTSASSDVVSEGGHLLVEIDTGTADRVTIDRHRIVTSASPDDDVAPAGIDVLVTPDLLDALGLVVGDRTTARLGGLRTDLRLVGTTPVVPFAVDQPMAILVDHAVLSASGYLASGDRAQPDRWALVVDPGEHDAVAATLRALPFASTDVADRWAATEQRTRDPVLVGLAGSLLTAVVAVGVIAVVGLSMAAVTGARDRRGSHAVLRALGASRRELRRWLFRESVPLGAAAIVLGMATGWLIAALVLDSLTGDRDGTAAIPPPVLVVPPIALGVMIVGALLAVVLLPMATSRLLRGVRPADELRIGGAQ